MSPETDKKNATIQARLPVDQLDQVRKATDNVSRYIRDAIAEKLRREQRRRRASEGEGEP